MLPLKWKIDTYFLGFFGQFLYFMIYFNNFYGVFFWLRLSKVKRYWSFECSLTLWETAHVCRIAILNKKLLSFCLPIDVGHKSRYQQQEKNCSLFWFCTLSKKKEDVANWDERKCLFMWHRNAFLIIEWSGGMAL